MSSTSAILEAPAAAAERPARRFPLERLIFYVLGAVALVYAFLAGLKTIADFDLGWQMATGRWIVQHHQIPSTEVFSYTAAGQPWMYPVGAGPVFYGAFLLGGYSLISWLAAFACAGVIAILLRRGSAVSAGLAIFAVPLIVSRVTPRAEMFTIVLFAATLSLLWQQYQTGKARLWLLPVMMVAWVNLHPGFIAGLGLLAAYAMLEVVAMLRAGERDGANARLRRAFPWLTATCAATLLNPWGWNIYEILSRQEGSTGGPTQSALEWAPTPLNWTHIASGLSPRDPDGFYVLLGILLLAVPVALWRRQAGVAILMAGAVIFPIRHISLTALFSVVMVIVGGAVVASLMVVLQERIANVRTVSALAVTASFLMIGLAAMRVTNVVTDRSYRSGAELVSFGTGLSWWFPEKAAAFIEREHLSGQIFSSGSEGAFLAFRLGPKYKNYIDARAIPFGAELMLRNANLKANPPDSPQWKQEAERYGINTILVPIGRYGALQLFPVLKQFCSSDTWRPVYLDEVSAVFVWRTPQTEALIERLQVNCSAAPLPAVPPTASDTRAFNQWANAASVLRALGRDLEAFVAIRKALAIFPDSGYLHFMRGHIYQEAGGMREAEQEYVLATKLEPNLVAPWSGLASFYQEQRRLPDAIHAWERAAGVSRWPWEPLKNLGYANLLARQPKQALNAFDNAASSLPSHYELVVDNAFLANVAHGRARSWYHLGDLHRAIAFEEDAARFLPGSSDLWRQLADLYTAAGRNEDANRARAHAGTPN